MNSTWPMLEMKKNLLLRRLYISKGINILLQYLKLLDMEDR